MAEPAGLGDEPAAASPPRSLLPKKKKKVKGRDVPPLVPGLIYISRVPPFMQPLKLRQLLGAHGEVLRIYMAPEGGLPARTLFSSTPRVL